MPPSPQPAVISLDVPLRPDDLVEAWRPDSRQLVIPTRESLRLQQRVAARISAVGLGVAATITGRVVSAGRHGNQYRTALVPDETRVRALERLLEVARGAAIEYQTRLPRFLAAVPTIVQGVGGPTYMNTFSVSAHGCGLAWSGPLPAVGVPVDVRLGAGTRASSFRGVVCWTARSGRAATVGVRFVAGTHNAWTTMLAELKSAGAPLA